MENSKIEWTTHTFNPWMGCTKVSPGCKNCYAMQLMDTRYGKVKWGPAGERIRTSKANWRKPHARNKQAAKEGTRPRVFCASLADVFEDKPNQPEMNVWRAELFSTIIDTPNLDWLLLTKRPENVNRMIAEAGEWWFQNGAPTTYAKHLLRWMKHGLQYALPNMWIGTSVEDQEQADKRIPELLRIPAKVRFLSMEPLLGKVDLGFPFTSDNPYMTRNHVDWVIVGGESGPNARPMHPDWVMSIKDQCQGAGIPFFFKQWGEWLPPYAELPPNVGYDPERIGFVKSHRLADVYLNPGTSGLASLEDPAPVWRVGKKEAGRLLDGVEWNGYPEVRP